MEAQKAENGNAWPETVAVVLWGTDNIKTYGESLAQVMMMVGINPVADPLGRVNKLEVNFHSSLSGLKAGRKHHLLSIKECAEFGKLYLTSTQHNSCKADI